MLFVSFERFIIIKYLVRIIKRHLGSNRTASKSLKSFSTAPDQVVPSSISQHLDKMDFSVTALIEPGLFTPVSDKVLEAKV